MAKNSRFREKHAKSDKLLEKSGVEASSRMQRWRVYRDLDSLAGTWTAKEASEFQKAVTDFEQVDPELWRC